jgi:MYXO-CTERM domain-containing protein
VPEIGLKAASATVEHAGELPKGVALQGGGGACGACRVGSSEAPAIAGLIASVVAALAWLVRRRDHKE